MVDVARYDESKHDFVEPDALTQLLTDEVLQTRSCQQVAGGREANAAAEANVSSDLVAFDEGYILDQEADHTLAFPLGCLWVIPDGGEVLDE